MLRTHKLGEADRIVVLMTEGRGKVRAVAKGARKPGSRYAARLEPPVHTAVQLHKGRDLDTVTQVETIEHYAPVRDDMHRFSDAMALAEAVDYTAMEGEPNPPLFNMLTGALRTLASAPERPPLLVTAFYWKLLALEGVAPVVDQCARCGAGEGDGEEGMRLVSFDLPEGGALCELHRRGPAVDPAALDLLRGVLDGRLAAVLALPASPTAEAAMALASAALEAHLERPLRVVRLAV